VMKKQEETFVKGAVKNGLTQKKAEEIYNLIAPFAGYGFNKAHASCYATIAFRTAYLKAHYSVEFMTALLTAESRGSTGPAKNEKISQAVAECRRLNVNVLPPSINFSGDEFSIEDTKNVRFGLSAIKNVGSAAISTILGARANGKFESFSDFCLRVDLSKVNKKTLESLIKAGAMDEFGKRASLLYAISSTVDRITKEKNKVKSQASLFDNEPPSKISYEGNIPLDLEEFSDKEKLLFEKELLGFFLSDHPLSAELDNLIKYISHQIQNLIETPEGTRIKVGGLLSGVKKIITKKSNSEMAFITLEDHAGFSIECVVFPKTFEQYKNILLRDTIVLISGKLDFKDEIPVILVDTIERYKNTNQTTN